MVPNSYSIDNGAVRGVNLLYLVVIHNSYPDKGSVEDDVMGTVPNIEGADNGAGGSINLAWPAVRSPPQPKGQASNGAPVPGGASRCGLALRRLGGGGAFSPDGFHGVVWPRSRGQRLGLLRS